MEPKKKLKKFNGFKTKNKYVDHEPMRQNRYLMEFPLGDTMFECWVNCEIPSISMRAGYPRFGREWEVITHHQQEWQPIQVKIRDVLGDERNRSLFYSRMRDWFSDYNYTGRKINSTISRMDPTGLVVDRWDLRGCFVTAINYSNAYLEDTEPELEITLHYDFCNYISDI